jgi:tyrosyl-tRNA synthetase
MSLSASEQLAQLIAGTAKVLSKKELAEKLALGRPLRVKLGVDPTAPDIHFGHTVALEKLRQFQLLGHQAVLIIGDFTATVGDPTGRSATRPPLTREDVLINAETYTAQAFKILDRSKTEVVYNGDWFRKMTFEEVLKLNGRVTLQQMLQRKVGILSKCAAMSRSAARTSFLIFSLVVICKKKKASHSRW